MRSVKCKENHEETVDVDKIAITPTTEVLDSEVLKCSDCHNVPEMQEFSYLVQSKMEKFLKLQDSGLDMAYKCPKGRRCSDCLKGAGHEKLSMQQEVIKHSVKIDLYKGKAVASLAFTADPDKLLADRCFFEPHVPWDSVAGSMMI